MCTTLEEICEHLLSVYPDKGNNAAAEQRVKLVEAKQFGDAESVERQCAEQGRGRGQEGHAFLNTIVMNSFACHKVTKSKLKVRVFGLGQHLTTTLLQRMRGRLIGGGHSWKQRRSEEDKGRE